VPDNERIQQRKNLIDRRQDKSDDSELPQILKVPVEIESDLEFAGRLTQEQRSKLLEIAEKCPVHRTLVSEIDIRSRVL